MYSMRRDIGVSSRTPNVTKVAVSKQFGQVNQSAVHSYVIVKQVIDVQLHGFCLQTEVHSRATQCIRFGAIC